MIMQKIYLKLKASKSWSNLCLKLRVSTNWLMDWYKFLSVCELKQYLNLDLVIEQWSVFAERPPSSRAALIFSARDSFE